MSGERESVCVCVRVCAHSSFALLLCPHFVQQTLRKSFQKETQPACTRAHASDCASCQATSTFASAQTPACPLPTRTSAPRNAKHSLRALRCPFRSSLSTCQIVASMTTPCSSSCPCSPPSERSSTWSGKQPCAHACAVCAVCVSLSLIATSH